MSTTRVQRLVAMLGPGLLFAGSAIGVSHIYQSTRAGAEYGYALIGAVLLANLLKYPFFEFGPRYALASGESLLAGYLRLGRWVLVAYLALTVATIFTVTAAVTGVTVAILQHTFGWHGHPSGYAALLLVFCTVLLLAGHFRILDRTMKWVIVVLSVCTLLALAIAFGHPAEAASVPLQTFSLRDPLAVAFLIGLVGWMPAPIDLSVWHSTWALEKQRLNPAFGLRQAMLDFRIGYFGTTILAIVFLALGARMFYGQVEGFPASAAEFGTLLIDMYRYTLGEGAGWLIALAALATMFSTTLTVLDAIPRVLTQTVQLLGSTLDLPEPDEVIARNSADLDAPLTPAIGPEGARQERDAVETIVRAQRDAHPTPEATVQAQPRAAGTRIWYTIFLILLIIGALSLIRWFARDLRQLVDVATILSFATAPFFAVANLALVSGRHMPAGERPGLLLRMLSWLGTAFLIGFLVWYLVQRLGG